MPFAVPRKLLKWWKLSYNPIDQRLNRLWCGSVCIATDHEKWKKRVDFGAKCTNQACAFRVCVCQEICLYGIMFWLNRMFASFHKRRFICMQQSKRQSTWKSKRTRTWFTDAINSLVKIVKWLGFFGESYTFINW